jgi:hypothetical protein
MFFEALPGRETGPNACNSCRVSPLTHYLYQQNQCFNTQSTHAAVNQVRPQWHSRETLRNTEVQNIDLEIHRVYKHRNCTNIVVFWHVAPCDVVGNANVSEVLAASIIRATSKSRAKSVLINRSRSKF